jgi:3-isopropylmalate dehydrogenase
MNRLVRQVATTSARHQTRNISGKIAVLPGDGIGPEIVTEAVKCLHTVAKVRGHKFEYDEQPMGGAAIDLTGEPLPASTLNACKESGGALMGSVGTPKYGPESPVRPEQGLLAIRKELGLFCNLRPVNIISDSIAESGSSIKMSVLKGTDMMFVRELTGGIYFGKRVEDDGSGVASDLEEYTTMEVERVTRVAAQLARKRRNKVTSVDKANVLASSRLWRKVVMRVMAEEFPDVEIEHALVDSLAMDLIRRPRDFDVLVTTNIFGDILSDEASVLPGSLGLLPSASLGEGSFGLYEPIHGSAPDIAGQGVANPLATILSAAMMLRHSFNLETEAKAMEKAVEAVLDEGYRTPDLMEWGAPKDDKTLGTVSMGEKVNAYLADSSIY